MLCAVLFVCPRPPVELVFSFPFVVCVWGIASVERRAVARRGAVLAFVPLPYKNIYTALVLGWCTVGGDSMCRYQGG